MTKKIKAIFSECHSDLWIDIAKRLFKKYNWEPCYWIGVEGIEQKTRENFPGIVFHETYMAIRGVAVKELECDSLHEIDQPMLKELSYYETITLKMMDRMDAGGSFLYQERVRFYHRQLIYWTTVLDRMKPDVVVFSTVPHVIYDYILYILCCSRGIKTITFKHTCLEHCVLISNRFDEESSIIPVYRKLYLNTDDFKTELSTAAKNHLDKLKRNYEFAKPFYLQNYNPAIREKKQKNKSISLKLASMPDLAVSIFRWVRKIAETILSFFQPSRPNYLKKKRKKVEDFYWTDFEYRWHKYLSSVKKKKLNIYYNKISKNVDLSKPYIYVALHYQPEVTTSPMGEQFDNQVLMVDLIAKSISKGWGIYVKEHPGQFNPRMHGERYRDYAFYDEIASLPNVTFVSYSISPFALIDNAKCVACVSGTSGWEAVVRGTPVLIFGHAWYKGCEGVFYTPSYEKCKAAISMVAEGFEVDERKVKLFIQALEMAGLNGYVYDAYAKISEVPYDENVMTISDAIHSKYC